MLSIINRITMGDYFTKILAAILVVLATTVYAQQGPGGVSVETADFDNGTCRPDTNSTCGMWLDASTLTTFADGEDVLVWPDVSISHDCDDAVKPASVNVFAPIFRNDPASTINGLPTITFEANRHFILSSSDDLNTNRVTYNKMVFMAFRASEDVTSKQMIYEEGGNVRGFNILIHNGDLIIGAYDKQGNDNDCQTSGNPASARTNAWGYSYISRSIQPNTTYILTAQYHADDCGLGNIYNDANYFLQGWLNGIPFGGPNQLQGGSNSQGFNSDGLLGTLYNHPNPSGLGAVNDDTVTREGQVNNQSGSLPFKGKLAEVCYYKDEVQETQRIIIENYMAAKYLATLDTQDNYAHEFTFGKDVIGIGRRVNPEIHNLSQGRNPFVISTPSTMSTAANQFYLTGHNGLNAQWSADGVPQNSSNIERLLRVWRVERTNFNYPIHFSLDEDKLPDLPTGYSIANAKLVLLVDETSANIPDFTLETTIIQEIPQNGIAPFDYSYTYNFPDDAFYTFAWLRPEVNFELDQSFSLESDPAPAYQTEFVLASLNYTPVNNGDATNDGYNFTYNLTSSGVAILGPGVLFDDFYYDSATPGLTSGTVTFNEGIRTQPLILRIINDTDPEAISTEDFTINITGTNSIGNTPTLLIGANMSMTYTIYDDDPPPKLSFASYLSPVAVNESAGTVSFDVVLSGAAVDNITCTVDIIPAGTDARGAANGMDPQDFSPAYTSLISFPLGGPVTQTVVVPIMDDLVDEYTESIQFKLNNFTGTVSVLSLAALTQDVEIQDNDIPVATFASASQSGFESIGAPSLLVTLSPISSREVVVDFSMNPPLPSPQGTATYSQDYAGALTGTVVFPPFIDEAFIGPFFVYPDGLIEGSESVIFELTGTTPNGGIKLIQPDELTYLIFDYEPFEWKGAAGIGKTTDNIIWIDATQEGLGNLPSLANRSPYSLAINQSGGNPATNIANGINNQNSLEFNGSATTGSADSYLVSNNTKINTAGTVDRLSYYFVMRPDIVPNSTATPNSPTTTHARLIYEQGGGTRGTSIYLYNNRLYFHVWNNANDDGNDNLGTVEIEGNQAPWGNNGNRANSIYAYSTGTILPNTNYIISCHYDNDDPTEPLIVYVNGEKGIISNVAAGNNQFGVGRLWGHAGRIGFGAVINAARFHFSNGSPPDRRCAFSGRISEFISFHEPEMSESRRVIIENYLSGKYDISLDNNDTPQIWDLTDPDEDLYSNQIAGIGQEVAAASAHTDSQGPSAILRVNNPAFGGAGGTDMGYLMWGSNSETLTNTWPFSNAGNDLPAGINERSGQIWKFYEGGNVLTANINIDFSASNSSTALNGDLSLLKLLVHSNVDPQDFSNATVYPLQALPGGNIAQFSNVPISNGMYVTLANTSNYFNTPLPIELLSFDAKLNSGQVDLTWVTSTEINNDYFIIERAGGDLRWKELLSVPGAGNSNTQLSYADVDRAPLSGISYYRLKQMDFDGSYAYSDVVSVSNTLVKNDGILLYPNPSKTGSVFVTIPALTNDLITISLMNLTGNLLIKETKIGGSKSIFELNFGDLPSGIYLINVSYSTVNKTKKLVIE